MNIFKKFLKSETTHHNISWLIFAFVFLGLGMLLMWTIKYDDNPPTTRVWAEGDNITENSWRTGNGDLTVNYCGKEVTFSDWRTFTRYGAECPDSVYEKHDSGNIEKIIFSDEDTKVFFEDVEIVFPKEGEPKVKIGKKSEVLKGFDFTRPDTVLYEEGGQS